MPQDKNQNNNLVAVYSLLGMFAIILIIVASVFMIYQTKNVAREFNYIGRSPEQIKTMVFRGDGKINTKPDIAVVSMGLSVEKKSVSDAQNESSKSMNAFIAKLKTMGVESKDIKTANYNVYPQYDYPASGKSILRGYQITQNVEIKIRNLDKISDILGLAGEFNLNQVGNLSFDVDNKDGYEKQAKEDAIKKAKDNAESTARSLGIKLGRIVSYDEYNVSSPVVYNGYKMLDSANVAGMGGSSSTIESGNAEINVSVGITYEIN